MNDTVFNGMFNQNCQEDSIHDSVKCILSTILHGNVASSPHYKQAILTIGQLIRFNTLKRTRKSSSSAYHSKDREPPRPVFLAEYIHSKTRNRSMIEEFSQLGLSISKDRWLQISTSLGNSSRMG